MMEGVCARRKDPMVGQEARDPGGNRLTLLYQPTFDENESISRRCNPF
jgi:hypothetical protein